MKVCFSGTFNVLHNGHKALIDKAFEYAGDEGTVYIGVTKGKIAEKKDYLVPFDVRVAAIKEYLKQKKFDKQAIIVTIFDKYGPAVYGDYDAIVVSPETYENACDINKKREANGLTPLKIIKSSYVYAEDHTPINATRILKREITKNGKILK